MKIFFSIIFFILLIIFLVNVNNKKKEHLKNIDKYYYYQLGDVIKGYMYKTDINKYNLYKEKYPDTLATKYINEVKYLSNNKKWNNLKILDKLTKSSKSIPIALHLRMGDVIGKYDKKTNTFIGSHDKRYIYFYQPFTLDKLFKQLKKNENIKEIHIFYGSHIRWDKNNDKYLYIAKKIITDNGFKIIDNSKGNSDIDFITMSNAKIFIKSGGGFSRTIAKLVKYRNNKVIDPSDYK